MEGILEGPALWGLLESAKNVLSLWHCILCSVFWILDIKSFLNHALVIPHSEPGIFSITRDLKIESFKPCHLVFVFIVIHSRTHWNLYLRLPSMWVWGALLGTVCMVIEGHRYCFCLQPVSQEFREF